jgi:cell division protein DivIC
LNRVITSLYLVIFVGFGVGASILFLEARSEYNRLKQTQTRFRQVLAEKEGLLREQERNLERLKSDPAYLERIVRLRLGFVKPDETIYDFRQVPPGR